MIIGYMEDWIKDGNGRMRRVHKRYVDVVAHMRDGRTFRVTQVIEVGEFRPGFEGFFTAKYRVSIGNRRTNLYLEQHLNRPESGMPPTVRWWVHEFV